MMPSRPGPTLICLITASVFRSNIVTVWSPPLVVKPWPALVAMPAPCTPGVFGMSPSTLPVAPSTTIMCVPRDTNTRPVAGFDGDVVGAAVALDVELLDLEGLRGPDGRPAQAGGPEQGYRSKMKRFIRGD